MQAAKNGKRMAIFRPGKLFDYCCHKDSVARLTFFFRIRDKVNTGQLISISCTIRES